MTPALGRANKALETDRQVWTMGASESGNLFREWENWGLKTQGGYWSPHCHSGHDVTFCPHSVFLGHSSSLHLFKYLPNAGHPSVHCSAKETERQVQPVPPCVCGETEAWRRKCPLEFQ